MPDPTPPPPRWPLFAALAVAALVQKLANNFEGLTKLLVRDRVEEVAGGTAAAGAFLTACAVGYTIKPLFGVVIDRLPLFGYRRKSWLVAASAATSLAWAAVALTGATTYAPLLVGLMVVNVTVTFADVVCDGLMVEAGQAAEAAGAAPAGAGSQPYQVAQWAASLGGVLFAVEAGAFLVQSDSPHTFTRVAWACAALPAAAAVAAVFLVREPRAAWDPAGARAGFRAARLAVAAGAAVVGLKLAARGTWFEPVEPFVSPFLAIGPVLWLVRVPADLLAPVVLIVLWPALPLKADSQYFFTYMTDPNGRVGAAVGGGAGVAGTVRDAAAWAGLPGAADPKKFAQFFYGSVVVACEVAAGLTAVALMGRYARRVSRRRLLDGFLLAGGVAAVAFAALATFGGPAGALGCAALSGVVVWGGGTAVLFFAAGRVPSGGGSQATLFALLMGLSNLGGLFGVETVGAAAYQHGQAWAKHPDGGLFAVVGLSVVHLAVLAGVVRWLARRGELEPHPRAS